MPPKNRSIEAFAIYNLKNERLPEDVPGLKLKPGQLRGLLENLPVVMTEPEELEVDCQQSIDQFLGEATWHVNISTPDGTQMEIDYNEGVKGINDTPYRLEQPTETHKRSYVVDHPDFVNQWRDEYGNRYGAITLKGNNFSNPKIIEHPNASTGYIPYGQQESYVIERVLKASDVMRKAEIPTEYIIGLSLPKQLPWPALRERDDSGDWQPAQHNGHVMIGLHEYKQRLVNDKWMRLPENERTVETLLDLTDKFKDMMFYTTARAMDTEYRVSDMINAVVAEKVFEVFNLHYAKDFEIVELNPHKTEDVDVYFEQFLMPRLGMNFAKFHTMGLAHGFANSMNLSAFGSIVDLDSVHGEPLGLGDKPVTGKQKVADIINVMSDVWEVSQSVRVQGREFDPDDMPKNCMMQFMIQYFNETIKQFDDKKDARKYLADLMMELEWLKVDTGRMAGQLKPFMQEAATACYFVFFHEADMLQMKDEISDAITEAIGTFGSEKNRRRITKELRALIKERKQAIMHMLQSDITKQYAMGDDLDIVNLLFSSPSPGAMLMRADLEETIAQSLLRDMMQNIYKQKTTELGLHDAREVHILWQFAQSVQQAKIFEAIAGVDEVANRHSLIELYMDDAKTLGYKITDNILKERYKKGTGVYGAQDGLSFAENELWVLNHNIPFYDIDDMVRDDIPVETMHIQNDMKDGATMQEGGAVIIKVASNIEEGYHITQIVTDGKLIELSMDKENTGKVNLVFGNEDRPIYVLIAETNKDGHQRVTKTIDSERFNEAAEYLFSMVDLGRVENGELFSVEHQNADPTQV